MNRYTGDILEDKRWYEYEHGRLPTKLYLDTDDYHDLLSNGHIVHIIVGNSRYKLYGMNVILGDTSRYSH
ncbi:hypothetical protein [Arthronema virus TR020]|uniref:Uncharacterized protein n=1 Tax=Arthronema virus TR020 TaxID=2736280 RepID=A0A7G3WH25_9CAUD|nr:hypothetical protein [Arthronema virus TR020]